jgi:hypothetical protein
MTAVSRSFSFQTWNGRAVQNVGVPFAVNPMTASGFRGYLPPGIGGCPTSEIADGIPATTV